MNTYVQANLFGGIDDGFFSARAELMDMKNSAGAGPNPMLKHDMLPTYAPFGPSSQSGLHSAMDFHLDAISSAGAVPSTMSMMAAEQHHMNMAAAGIGPHQFAQYPHATIPTMSAPSLAGHPSLAQAAAAAVVKEQVSTAEYCHYIPVSTSNRTILYIHSKATRTVFVGVQ